MAAQGVETGARNTLAAEIIGCCIEGLTRFAHEGFAPFIAAWRSADALRDQPVRVLEGSVERVGIARGIDQHGALQLETTSGQHIALIGGEVSVRREGLR